MNKDSEFRPVRAFCSTVRDGLKPCEVVAVRDWPSHSNHGIVWIVIDGERRLEMEHYLLADTPETRKVVKISAEIKRLQKELESLECTPFKLP